MGSSLHFGQVLMGTVTGIVDYGAFVETEGGHRGLVHVSEISSTPVPKGQVADYLSVGQRLHLRVVRVDHDGGRHAFSVRRVQAPESAPAGSDAASWQRFVRHALDGAFTSPEALARLRRLERLAGAFELGLAMGKMVSSEAIESAITESLQRALGVKEPTVSEHAVDRYIEKVDPHASRTAARAAIKRHVERAVMVREPNALYGHDGILFAVTLTGSVTTVYPDDQSECAASPPEAKSA